MPSLCGSAAFAADPPLRSPWDIAVPVRPETGAACPTPPALPAAIVASDYYSDPAHSIADPERKRAYVQAVRPLDDAARTVDSLADRYRAGGDEAAALCAAAWLDRFARDGALAGSTATNQAVYVQGWLSGSFAIAWLKVRAVSAIPADERSRVAAWLATLASLNERYYAGRPTKTDGRNNHRYWAGLAVMAAGIAADRRDLFDWGIASFRIGADQIAPDGTLPLELARRSLALHYHLFAAAPLVAMAELAAANGLDLYALEGGALPRLVRRSLAGVADPSSFAARAGETQAPVKLDADTLAWAAPFARRFPDPTLDAMLARLPSRAVLYLGGIP